MYIIGTVLRTKDGRIIGNGIITGFDFEKKMYAVQTDFGNHAWFTEKELRRAFYFAEDLDVNKQYTPLDEWVKARSRLIEEYMKYYRHFVKSE